MAGPPDLLGGEAMRFAVTEGFHVGVTDEALEAHLDLVLQALYELGVDDADVGGSLASGDVEISMIVKADSFRSAQKLATDLIRRAISTSGGTLVDGNGSESARIRGLLFDLRSVGAERVGSA
jgi:hypothetical protein